MDKETKTFKRGDKEIVVDKEDLLYIFKGMRPRLMDYDDFRFVRSELNKELKRYKKGHLVHLSKVSNVIWAEYVKDEKYKPIQKGHTYVRKEK